MADGVRPYSRAERLLNLLMALRGTRSGLSRNQIRSVVRGYDPGASPAAFERMFERDKDDLRAMGVPLATLTDATGVVTGYRIDGDWTLPPLALDRAELAILGLAARVWQQADLAPAALNALRKVEASLGMRSAPEAAAPIAGLSADSPELHALIGACTAGRAVLFDYRRGGQGPGQLRHVQPWGAVWWRAHWYLVGFDTDRDDLRVFRASWIDGPVRTDPHGEPFRVPEGFDARDAVGRFSRAGATTLQVALAPGVGAALRRDSRPLGPDADGWDVVELPVEELTAGVGMVLAYGSGVRVVGPARAVDEAVRQLDAVVASHVGPAAPAGRRQTPAGGRTPGVEAQFARLLALVPWLAANSGVRVEEAAAHFGITEEQLLADLGSVITSGADDWTLFDIQYWENGGVIEVIDALDLAEPLSLTPDEGLALIVALDALAALPGGHGRAALESTTAALRSALGSHAPAPGSVAVRVDLPPEVVATVEQALDAGRAVELTYLGAVRDEVTRRLVDPIGVVVVDGFGYLRAFCRSAQALRLFRMDRILAAEVSAEAARPTVPSQAETVEPMSVSLASTGRRVVVDAAPGSTVLDRNPSTRRWALPDGWTRAELPVGDFGWARRLALGSAGTVVLREPMWLAEQVVDVARSARVAHGHESF